MKSRYIFSIAAVASVMLMVAFTWHHINQSQLGEAMLATQKPNWMVAKPDTVKREVGRLENRSILFFQATSNLENTIFLKITNRTSINQSVTMFVITKNTNWIFSTAITNPSQEIFEKWLVTPTNDQIKNLVLSTKKAPYIREDISLLPGESILTSAQFVFPYPMTVDFYADVYLFQRINRGFDNYSKAVRDSVLVRANDLNAAIVQ